MKKQEKERIEWPQQVQSHRQNCELAFDDFQELETKIEAGADISPLVRQLKEQLCEIHHEADMLHETLVAGPMTKLFSVDRVNLSKQDFFLLQASGAELFTVKGLGICSIDDYDVYRNCVYEDSMHVCFLDPNETPDVGTFDEQTGRGHIRLRIAMSPEELELKHLRPEQREFFEKYRPDVLARLQKIEE